MLTTSLTLARSQRKQGSTGSLSLDHRARALSSHSTAPVAAIWAQRRPHAVCSSSPAGPSAVRHGCCFLCFPHPAPAALRLVTTLAPAACASQWWPGWPAHRPVLQLSHKLLHRLQHVRLSAVVLRPVEGDAPVQGPKRQACAESAESSRLEDVLWRRHWRDAARCIQHRVRPRGGSLRRVLPPEAECFAPQHAGRRATHTQTLAAGGAGEQAETARTAAGEPTHARARCGCAPVCPSLLQGPSCIVQARLQKMQNPTGNACAAAPRFLKTLARAGSLRAASGRFLKTLGQNLSSWREIVPVAPHFPQPGVHALM